jgi:methylmalonyl-CoA mutase, C-terminal domain
MERKKRILVTKIGLDGHDRGAKAIAYALRDAGFEVIFLGVRQTPEHVVNTAIQEAVDVIGLSILSGAHMTLTRRVIEGLKEKGSEDISVIVGGTIPKEDIGLLKDMGVVDVFTSGVTIDRVVQRINEHLAARAA